MRLFGYVKSSIHNIVYGLEPEYLKCFFAHLLNGYDGGFNNTLRISGQGAGALARQRPGSLYLDISQSNFRTGTPLLRQQLDIGLFYGQQIAPQIRHLNLSNSHLGQDFNGQLRDRLYEFLVSCTQLEELYLQEYQNKGLSDMVCDLLSDKRFGARLTTLSLVEFADGNQVLEALQGLEHFPRLHTLCVELSQPKIKSFRAVAGLFVPGGIENAKTRGQCCCRVRREETRTLDVFQEEGDGDAETPSSPLRVLILQQSLTPSALSGVLEPETANLDQFPGDTPESACSRRVLELRRMAGAQSSLPLVQSECAAARWMSRFPVLPVLAGRFPGQRLPDLRVLELSWTSLGAADVQLLERLLAQVSLCEYIGLEYCRLNDAQCARLIRAFFGVEAREDDSQGPKSAFYNLTESQSCQKSCLHSADAGALSASVGGSEISPADDAMR